MILERLACNSAEHAPTRIEGMNLADARDFFRLLHKESGGLAFKLCTERPQEAVIVFQKKSVVAKMWFGFNPETEARDGLIHLTIAHDPRERISYQRNSKGRYTMVL